MRSCEVAPALADAMQTMAPTMSAIDWCMSLVQCIETKMRQVAIKVAMVMPEIGFDELPMMPTMRDDTVTKKKPKTTMSTAMNSEPGNVPGRLGRSAMMATSADGAEEDEA